jgi:hypothetical protein
VVGEGQGGHTQLYCLCHRLVQPAHTVQEAVVGVEMEMDEVAGGQRRLFG